MEGALTPEINYLGQMDFGIGNIGGSEVSSGEFKEMLLYVAGHGLMTVEDYKKEFGSCMDGRDNDVDETGAEFDPRSKVLAGPSGFGWYVASIGQFSLLKPGMSPLEAFKATNQRLVDADFRLGMHHYCGGARGVKPVTKQYDEKMDDIDRYIGDEARQLAVADGGRYRKDVKTGLYLTRENLEKAGDNFTEEAMMEVVRQLDGPKAIIHLKVDHEHPNHGHDEAGHIFLRRPHTKINKPLSIENGVRAFYTNVGYAHAIVRALARDQEEFRRGVLITDQLSLAAVATLGNHQHVGEIL